MRPPVTVLGLGRLGSAIAARLVDDGWEVSGWTRSGRTVPGVRPLAAPAGAELLLLCLFDGGACREILDAVELPAGAVVVNTSTIAPDEATALSALTAERGGTYVHAPVMGSVVAARGGALTVLAGGADVARAKQLLASLGEVLEAGDVADSALLKLAANATLAGSLQAIRAGLAAGASHRDPARVLDVLEHTAVGSLVRAKRGRLGGEDDGAAEFTIGALAKDVRLAAGRDPALARVRQVLADALASGRVGAEDDIADLARPEPDGAELEHGLTIAPGVAVGRDVLAPLLAYVRGHATGDPSHFAKAFWPTAHVEGLRDGAFCSWDLATYAALFPGHPAEDEPHRTRQIESVAVRGTVATAELTLWHGPDTFSDAFVLLRADGVWRIANKVYHRHA